MNGFQIKSLLKKLTVSNSFFSGVYTDKILPFEIIEKDKAVIIVNISFRNKKIGHWVVMYIYEKTLYFFDSYAKKPQFYGGNIDIFCKLFQGAIVFPVKKSIQEKGSFVCGGYSLYFAECIFKNMSISETMSIFSQKKPFENDVFIKNFVYSLIGSDKICKPQFCYRYMFNSDCNESCPCVK